MSGASAHPVREALADVGGLKQPPWLLSRSLCLADGAHYLLGKTVPGGKGALSPAAPRERRTPLTGLLSPGHPPQEGQP